MKFVSPVLRRVVYPALQRAALLPHWARAGSLSVVTYHGVLPPGYRVSDRLLDGGWVTPESFRNQLRLLRSRYNVVTPEQVRRWCKGEAALPPRAVLLTCDDGLANAVSDILPILREEGLTCLFFVTAESLAQSSEMLWYEELYLSLLAAPEGPLRGEFCGVTINTSLSQSVYERHAFWWSTVSALSSRDSAARLGFSKAIRDYYQMPPDWQSRYLDGSAARFRLLTTGEVRELLDAGMSVGSHTISHPKLSRLPAEECWKEISASRCELEKKLGTPIWSIAYPFGGTDSVSDRELRMAERAGYDCAFTNFGGGFGPVPSRFGIPRMHVTLDMTLAEFEGHLCGLHERLRRYFGHTEHIPSACKGGSCTGGASDAKE